MIGAQLGWFTVLLIASCLSGTDVSAEGKPTKVLILGDSIAEGYGLSSKDEAFPSLVEKLAHESGHPEVQVINGGVSGSTSASALSRLRWHLKAHPDIVVIELGGNDGLRGLKVEEMRKNLVSAIDLAKVNHLKVLLAGQKIPLNYGADYRQKFEAVFAEVARSEHVALIPFVLMGVGGDPALSQADMIHPNSKGHAIVAKTVYKYLAPLL